MKLKKMGALLLALCMIFMVFPITAKADENRPSEAETETKTYEYEIQNMENFEIVDQMNVVDGMTTQYRIELFSVSPDGMRESVSTDSVTLNLADGSDLNFSEYLDYGVKKVEYGDDNLISITGKKAADFAVNKKYNLKVSFMSKGTSIYDADIPFEFIEPTDIDLNKVYNISDNNVQYFRYQPVESGEQYYSLRTENAVGLRNDGWTNGMDKGYYIYKSMDKKPILFCVDPIYGSKCEVQLVKHKLVKNIKIKQIPDSVLKSIKENGDKADFNGIEFEATYADGSKYTHVLNGKKITAVEGNSDPFVFYVMDCWNIDGNSYDCYPQLKNNTIRIYSSTYLKSGNLSVFDEIEIKPADQTTGQKPPVSVTRKVSKIIITGISKQIAAGRKIKLTAKITPSNATNKALKWKSSNTKVATVTQAGVVTLKKNSGGKTVTITATAKDGSGKKASYRIRSMKGAVKKVKISGAKTVKAGKSLKLKAKVTATKGANKKLKWTSSNTKYAKVSSSGKVTTKKAGKRKTVKITAQATDGTGKKATIKIKIK